MTALIIPLHPQPDPHVELGAALVRLERADRGLTLGTGTTAAYIEAFTRLLDLAIAAGYSSAGASMGVRLWTARRLSLVWAV